MSVPPQQAWSTDESCAMFDLKLAPARSASLDAQSEAGLRELSG